MLPNAAVARTFADHLVIEFPPIDLPYLSQHSGSSDEACSIPATVSDYNPVV